MTHFIERVVSLIPSAVVLSVAAFLSWAMIELASVHQAQAQTSAQTSTNTADIALLKHNDSELSVRMGTVERSTIRIETMMEMSLKAQGIKPPPQSDGGM